MQILIRNIHSKYERSFSDLSKAKQTISEEVQIKMDYAEKLKEKTVEYMYGSIDIGNK
jgi:hypothetical protein